MALTWLAISGAAVALGFVSNFLRWRHFRLAALAAAFGLPVLFVLALGLADGCALKWSGDECFGFGFGLAIAISILPVWVFFVAVGAWLKRRVHS